MVRNFTVQGEVPELHHENSYASRLYSYMGQKNQVEWLLIHFWSHNYPSGTKLTLNPAFPDMKLSQHLKQTYHDGHCNDGEQCTEYIQGTRMRCIPVVQLRH